MEDTGTKAGTIGGTFLTVAANIHNDDMIKTIVLAAIGAIVSFSVSLLMKLLILKLRKHLSKQE
jgi:mannitol-specific phosphotransferase system IIBC component